MSKPTHSSSGPSLDSPHHLKSEEWAIVRKHLVFGWWALLVYLMLGIALETMHGFKIGYLLDASNETRRLLWRLGHAHGTLLALINIVFAITAKLFGTGVSKSYALASRCLVGSTVLLPAGFLLGGVVVYGGDPSLPILLVPIGAALLVIGVCLAARMSGQTSAEGKRR